MSGSQGISRVPLSPQGCFVIEDNRSKFGTLIEVKKPFRLDPQSTVSVAFQVGRTLLTFTLKRRWRFLFPSCLRYNQQADVSLLMEQNPTTLNQLPIFRHVAAMATGSAMGNQYQRVYSRGGNNNNGGVGEGREDDDGGEHEGEGGNVNEEGQGTI